jgi:hypothetical protein
LTRHLFWLTCANLIVFQEITLSSGITLLKGTSCIPLTPVSRISQSALDYKSL